jgi:hypothetical protein
MEVFEWVAQLLDEIEEPTLVEKAEAFCLLLAEVESWSSLRK